MEIKINLEMSKEEIDKINQKLTIQIDKLTDLKFEIYMINVFNVLEKYKDKVFSYDFSVEDEDGKHYFSLNVEKEDDSDLTNNEENELLETVHNFEILNESMMDYKAWEIKEYFNETITIYNNENILYKLATYFLGSVEGELWYSKKTAEQLNEVLQESIVEKPTIKKPKI